MSRFLLAWELGMNLGHLARMKPIASRLRSRGHRVLIAVREVPAAAAVLGADAAALVQAPHVQGQDLAASMNGYADVLLTQGWQDVQILWGLTQAWLQLIRLYRPDVALLNHAPTARLATRVAGIPAIMIGNGFEIPPTLDLLPPFPIASASASEAAASERIALNRANAVLERLRGPAVASLSELFNEASALCVTLPELDPYGVRPTLSYGGPLLGAAAPQRLDWPAGPNRVFACLRPDTPHWEPALGALRASGASVICFAPGFTAKQLEPYARPCLTFSSRLVDLKHLAPDADLCLSYGGEGTIETFLVAGVPQVIIPSHIEAEVLATRLEDLGVAVVLRGLQSRDTIAEALERAGKDSKYRQKARELANRHRGYDPDAVADDITDRIEAIVAGQSLAHAHYSLVSAKKRA